MGRTEKYGLFLRYKIMEWNTIVDLLNVIIRDIKKERQYEDPIKDGIFNILEEKCTVIYYPFPEEKNRGFHLKKIVGNELRDFVYINTGKTIEQQVFTAAHEMGHVWNVSKKVRDLAINKGLEIGDIDDEKVTDRFAAELLMPTDMFIGCFDKHVREFNYGRMITLSQLLRLIAKLMDDFMSPFNAVRKRLFECGLLQDDKLQRYLKDNKVVHEKIINSFKQDDNSPINGTTGVKTISGLRDLVKKAEKSEGANVLLIKTVISEFGLEDVEEDDTPNIEINKRSIK